MRQQPLKLLISSALLVGLSGCGSAQPAEDSTPAPALRLPIVQVLRQDVPKVLNLTGTVNALPDHSVKVSPAIAGKLISVAAIPGERIARGQVIARLDSRQATDQLAQATAALEVVNAGVAQAQTNRLLAQNNLSRVQMLYSEKIAPQKDLIAAQSQLATATEQVRAAQAQVAQVRATQGQARTQLSFSEVRSPISGVVASRFLNAGDTADTATPIVQIVDLETVIVSANLPADASAVVHVGDRGQIRSAATAGSLVATVTAVSPVVDLQNNALAIQLRCANPQTYLKEGQSVSVQITTGVHRGVMTIPKTALVPDPEHPEGHLVYQFQGGKIRRVKVQTGIEVENRVEITSGLGVNTQIVARGAYGLPDDTAAEASR
ncbi:MAG: efflux RND transporter periplasmic adaptor subunit [Anaerolineae bacterium]|nr:efflux RND transporter periplasmic adaptor subunit [Gloeobacterales cyanobacterium ES-bin-313]